MDIGQGWKPPGHYVQRSCGLFPAPYPQSSPEIEHVCRLFELLGIFIAKCIQDKRRVDLPLARPFFKLMSKTPQHSRPLSEELEGWTERAATGEGGGGGESEGDVGTQPGNNKQVSSETNDEGERESGESNRAPEDDRNNVVLVTSREEARAATTPSPKEAELLLAAEAGEEITKDQAAEKEELLVLEELGETAGGAAAGETEGGELEWYHGILQMEDFEEVNPHR